MGKLTISTGPCSIAMFVYQRVTMKQVDNNGYINLWQIMDNYTILYLGILLVNNGLKYGINYHGLGSVIHLPTRILPSTISLDAYDYDVI